MAKEKEINWNTSDGHKHMTGKQALQALFGRNDRLIGKEKFMIDYEREIESLIKTAESLTGYQFTDDDIRMIGLDEYFDQDKYDEFCEHFETEVCEEHHFDIAELADKLCYVVSDHNQHIASKENGESDFYKECAITAMKCFLEINSDSNRRMSISDIAVSSFNTADHMLREYRSRKKILNQHNI